MREDQINSHIYVKERSRQNSAYGKLLNACAYGKLLNACASALCQVISTLYHGFMHTIFYAIFLIILAE